MNELFHNFGVNWKLLLAQVVNFSILLYVLKRFAYGPIVAMLEERRARIRKGLEDASAAERALRDAEVKESDIVEAAHAKALDTVVHAEELARGKEADMLADAREKAESVKAAALRSIAEERAKMMDEIHRDAHELVELATARVLGKMEPEERDRILVREALDELKKIAPKLEA